MRISVEPVAGEELWSELGRSRDRSVFCTPGWLSFLEASQGAQPVHLRVLADGQPIGGFTGAIVRRGPVRMLGSPLPGWTTSYMGTVLDHEQLSSVGLDATSARTGAIGAVRRWAHTRLGCVHLEVLDRQLAVGTTLPRGLTSTTFHSFERLLEADDALLGSMTTNGRRNIRRADQRGVQVEVVPPDAVEGFASEYYEMALETFGRRSVAPTYPRQRVEQLIHHLHPTGHLLLLRVRTAEGDLAATALVAGLPGAGAVFLMGAATQQHLEVRPNDAAMWAAMRWWRDRGAITFDFGGGGEYKRKFGPRAVESLWIRSALPGTETVRALLRRSVKRDQRRRHVARSAGRVPRSSPYTGRSAP